MSRLLENLNPQQREAATTIHGPVLILAGAGTGKTKTITSRIAHMVIQKLDPHAICAVTFTNKAANEMRERVGKMVKKESAQALTISTFHSLCVRILRQSIDRLGYKRNFTIFTASDQMGLVRKLIARKSAKDEKVEPSLVLSLISKAKADGFAHEDGGESLVADIYRAYQTELKLLNAVDFDDLLILAEKLLREHPDVQRQWSDRFQYLMVDEFQDTNKQQMALLQHLGSAHQNVCVVGDDDQSIYGWRGADLSNILEFERFFPNPKIVKLEENYRSTNPILKTANSLIRHNIGRREKSLWSAIEGDEKLRLISMPGDEEEAETVVDEIVELNLIERIPCEHFAILFRTNQQSRIFEQKLRGAKVPYRVIGTMSFFDRREVKEVLAYLHVIANPDDDANMLRVINNPPRGIGPATITLASEISRKENASIYAVLQSESFRSQLSARARNAVAAFVDFLTKWQSQIGSGPVIDLCGETQNLVAEVGLIDSLKRNCKTEEEAASREKNLFDLFEGIRDFNRSNGASGLQGFLDHCSLSREIDERKDDDIDKKTGVTLITLHASKGLEFPHVYLVGLEEGILPHKRSVQEGTRDEERRLLYVGITRAQKRLTISWCHSRKRYGDPVPCLPSSFLKEIDDSWSEWLDYEEIGSQPASADFADSYFAKMKEMLGAD